jgi:hypothetical protein
MTAAKPEDKKVSRTDICTCPEVGPLFYLFFADYRGKSEATKEYGTI